MPRHGAPDERVTRALDEHGLFDLWHGDEARDWAGHEYDCCVEPRPEEVEGWRVRADLERAERDRQRARAQARERLR